MSDVESIVRRTLVAVAARVVVEEADQPELFVVPRLASDDAGTRTRWRPVAMVAAAVLVTAALVGALRLEAVRDETVPAGDGGPSAWIAVPGELPDGWRVEGSGTGPVEGSWMVVAVRAEDLDDDDGEVAPLEIRSSRDGRVGSFPEPRGVETAPLVLPGGVEARRHVAPDGSLDLRLNVQGVHVQLSALDADAVLTAARSLVLLPPEAADAVAWHAGPAALRGVEVERRETGFGLVERWWTADGGRLARCLRATNATGEPTQLCHEPGDQAGALVVGPASALDGRLVLRAVVTHDVATLRIAPAGGRAVVVPVDRDNAPGGLGIAHHTVATDGGDVLVEALGADGELVGEQVRVPVPG